MVAMLAFGGTYAYFTASTAKASGEVQTGKVYLSTTKSITTVIADDGVLPGDSLLKDDVVYEVETTDSGNYVAIQITIKATNNGADVTNALGLNSIKPGAPWTKGTAAGVYYLAEPVSDGGSATISKDDFKLSEDVDDNWVEGAGTSTLKLQDATVTVTIQAVSIQASNVTDAAEALTELEALLAALNPST